MKQAPSGGSSLSDTTQQLPHSMQCKEKLIVKPQIILLLQIGPQSLRKTSTILSKVKDVQQIAMSPVQTEVGLRAKLQKSGNLHGDGLYCVCERGRSLKERDFRMCSKRSQKAALPEKKRVATC